jgi:hypothetical protein
MLSHIRNLKNYCVSEKIGLEVLKDLHVVSFAEYEEIDFGFPSFCPAVRMCASLAREQLEEFY